MSEMTGLPPEAVIGELHKFASDQSTLFFDERSHAIERYFDMTYDHTDPETRELRELTLQLGFTAIREYYDAEKPTYEYRVSAELIEEIDIIPEHFKSRPEAEGYIREPEETDVEEQEERETYNGIPIATADDEDEDPIRLYSSRSVTVEIDSDTPIDAQISYHYSIYEGNAPTAVSDVVLEFTSELFGQDPEIAAIPNRELVDGVDKTKETTPVAIRNHMSQEEIDDPLERIKIDDTLTALEKAEEDSLDNLMVASEYIRHILRAMRKGEPLSIDIF